MNQNILPPAFQFGNYKRLSRLDPLETLNGIRSMGHSLRYSLIQHVKDSPDNAVVMASSDTGAAPIMWQPASMFTGAYMFTETIPYQQARVLHKFKALRGRFTGAGFSSHDQWNRVFAIPRVTKAERKTGAGTKMTELELGVLDCPAGLDATHRVTRGNDYAILTMEPSQGVLNVFVNFMSVESDYLLHAVIEAARKELDNVGRQEAYVDFSTYCMIGNPILEGFKQLPYPCLRRTRWQENADTFYRTMITSLRGQGLKVCVAPNTIGVGAHALAKNTGEQTPWRTVVIPSINVAQYRDVYSLDEQIELIDNGLYPQTVDIDSMMDLTDHDNCDLAVEPLRYRTLPAVTQGMLVGQLRNFGYHGDRAIRLEEDRTFGKVIAEQLGLNVLKHTLIESMDDLDGIDGVPGDKLVLKYNSKQFIGIYERDTAVALLPTLLKAGAVCIEQYVPTTSEVNYCFLVKQGSLIPMCELIETNRLMTNNSGGKTGTAWSAHKAAMFDEPGWNRSSKSFYDITQSMHRLTEHVEDVCGWVDLSFMIGDDGKLYFTEWMVRNSCSNFITLLHQMKMPYPELYSQFIAGETLRACDIWANTFSLGVEVYTLPLSSGADLTHFTTDYGIDALEGHDANASITFDLLEEACMTFDGHKYAVLPGTRRIGVFSMRTEALKFNGLKASLSIPAWTSTPLKAELDKAVANIPYLAYRMVNT